MGGAVQLDQRTAVFDGDVWLVANVGEDCLGELCGIRAVVDRFGIMLASMVG